MDRDLFKQNVFSALSRLPRPLLEDVAGIAKKVIVEHRTTIEAILPALASELMPQIQVIGFEKAMGQLNSAELEADVMEVLGNLGFDEKWEPRVAG